MLASLRVCGLSSFFQTHNVDYYFQKFAAGQQPAIFAVTM